MSMFPSKRLRDTDSQVLVNHSLAAGYVNALHELAQRYGLRDDISVSTVSRYSDILLYTKLQMMKKLFETQ